MFNVLLYTKCEVNEMIKEIKQYVAATNMNFDVRFSTAPSLVGNLPTSTDPWGCKENRVLA